MKHRMRTRRALLKNVHCLALVCLSSVAHAQSDVVVVGATPAGVMASVAAARAGAAIELKNVTVKQDDKKVGILGVGK